MSFILAEHTCVKMLALYRLLIYETVHSVTSLSEIILMSCITQPHIFHEISIKHCLAHLLLIILSLHIILLIVASKASNSSLVEHLLFLIDLVNIR